jgi:hypothetical protein
MAQAARRIPPSQVRSRFCVGFLMYKVTLGQVSLKVLMFSPVSIIPPWLFLPIYLYD